MQKDLQSNFEWSFVTMQGDQNGERMEKTSSGTSTVLSGSLKDTLVLQASRQDVVESIDDLRDHINRGCLSDVPPGEGTERNERTYH